MSSNTQNLVIVTLSEFGKLRTSGDLVLESSTRYINEDNDRLNEFLFYLSLFTDDEFILLNFSTINKESENKIILSFLNINTAYPLSEKSYLKYTQNYYPTRDSDPFNYSRDYCNTDIESIIKNVSEEKNKKILRDIFDITEEEIISFQKIFENTTEDNIFLKSFKQIDKILQFERKILLPDEPLSFCKDVIALSQSDNSEFIKKYNSGESSILDNTKLENFFKKYYPTGEHTKEISVFEIVEYNAKKGLENKAFAVQLIFLYIQNLIEKSINKNNNIFKELISIKDENKNISEFINFCIYSLIVKKYRYYDIYNDYYKYKKTYSTSKQTDFEVSDDDPYQKLDMKSTSGITNQTDEVSSCNPHPKPDMMSISGITNNKFTVTYDNELLKMVSSKKKVEYTIEISNSNKPTLKIIVNFKKSNHKEESSILFNNMKPKFKDIKEDDSVFTLNCEYSDNNLNSAIKILETIWSKQGEFGGDFSKWSR